MPPKKENLPINVDVDLDNGGTITYANEVIAIIAGVAANEIDGIAGMCTSGGFGDILGRNRNITRGVKVEIGSEEASVDLYAIVEYGKPIQKVASEVQENVRKAIETMTGLHVVKVDVHVQGVSFEKEKKEAQTGIEAANIPNIATGDEKKPEEQASEAPKPEEPAIKDEPEKEPEVLAGLLIDDDLLKSDAPVEDNAPQENTDEQPEAEGAQADDAPAPDAPAKRGRGKRA